MFLRKKKNGNLKFGKKWRIFYIKKRKFKDDIEKEYFYYTKHFEDYLDFFIKEW